jgi:hypothetical protein
MDDGLPLTQHHILQLQRVLGNHFTNSLVQTTIQRGRRGPGEGKEDRTQNKKKKKRGGHRGEHALPMIIQQDPDFTRWYHWMKQKRPGQLCEILGVSEMSAAFNLDAKGAKKLVPHYETWKAEKRTKPSAASSITPDSEETEVANDGTSEDSNTEASDTKGSDTEGSDTEGSDTESRKQETQAEIKRIQTVLNSADLNARARKNLEGKLAELQEELHELEASESEELEVSESEEEEELQPKPKAE